MKINAVSGTYNQQKSVSKGNKNQSFGLRLFMDSSVMPYLRAQATYMSIEKGPDVAQKWALGTWGLLKEISVRLKGLLYEDTPFVLAARKDAMENIIKNKKTYDGLDGMLVMDGRPMLIPTEMLDDVVKYSEPMSFKFGPDEKIVDNLVQKVSSIPDNVAKLFKPYM